MAKDYNAARGLSASAAASWHAAISRHIPNTVTSVLDLGSGTGRFSGLLSDWFDARVTAVEPSAEMRNQAIDRMHPKVALVEGCAEKIPIATRSVDFAWLGFMIHHVADHSACANELVRVVRPGGHVLVAGAFPGYLENITIFRYFADARIIAEAYPTLESIVETFERVGLTFKAIEPVAIKTANSLSEIVERVRLRADTTLSLIDDEAFATGLLELERAAAEDPRSHVNDILHLAVFRP
jgi:ubiquinone/menaquinone biosynthesis C-methylase UbiE